MTTNYNHDKTKVGHSTDNITTLYSAMNNKNKLQYQFLVADETDNLIP